MNALKTLQTMGGICIAILFVFFSTPTFAANSIIYVDAAATGGNDGSSWNDAFVDLQLALQMARDEDEVTQIWVAQGTYYPTNTISRDISFDLVNGVSLYGGFEGNESKLEDRIRDQFPTILNGDIGIGDEPSDNTLHVVRADGINEAGTVFDGFSITNGQADGLDLDGIGAGLLIMSKDVGVVTMLQVKHCQIFNNLAFYGGGLANYATNGAIAEPIIESSAIYNNFAQRAGGAYHYKGTGSQMHTSYYNCFFYGNEALNRGGAIWGHGNDGQVIDVLSWNVGLFNCVVYDNNAPLGAGIAAQDDNSIFRMLARNCTFYNNAASRGDAVYLHFNGSCELGNCIIWEGDSFFFNLNFSTDYLNVVNSMVQDLDDDQGQQELPGFVDVDARDFRLEACSPAIDQGINYGSPIATDPLGYPREYNSRVDMGAYEYVGTSISLPLLETAESILLADESITDPDGWTHYYNCQEDQLLLSVYTNGQRIGELGTDGFEVRIGTAASYGTAALNLSQADYLISNTTAWYVMNRYWELRNAQQPANPIKVRFYFADQDFTDVQNSLLNATGTLVDNPRELEFYNTSGAGSQPHDLGVLGSGGQYADYEYGDTSSLINWALGDFNGQQYAEIMLTVNADFFGGSAGARASSPLPVELLAFEGERIAQEIALRWVTTNEQNNDYFLLERSNDARSFIPIEMLPAKGAGLNEQTVYAHIDPNPFRGANYYRLKQYDKDGTYHYSNTLIVSFGNDLDQVIAYPNPVNEILNIQLPEELEGRVTLEVWDALRRIVYRQELEQNDQALIPLQLANLLPGMYTLKIRGKRYRAYHTFIKQDDY